MAANCPEKHTHIRNSQEQLLNAWLNSMQYNSIFLYDMSQSMEQDNEALQYSFPVPGLVHEKDR